MIRPPAIPVLDDPKLLDVALMQIQSALVSGLSWLDHSFGRAQVIKESKNKKVIISPAIYVGVKEYRSAFPDSHLGNFTFFDVSDKITVLRASRSNTEFEANIGLILWFDYRKVYPVDWQTRTIENIKDEVFAVFRGFAMTGLQPVIKTTSERANNIYKDYTDKEIDGQFLMRPYGGLRIDFTLKYNSLQNC